MFSYYGSKSKIVDLYPAPKFGKVIEPFAGSARYSLKYFDRDVLLVDKYDVIVKIWQWLQKCSKDDILKLSRLKPGQTLNDFTFDCDEARFLMGFLVAGASQCPRNKPTDRTIVYRPNSINFRLKFIASNLFKIKHWEIKLDSYENISNQEATWFIDPPYQVGGYVYKENNAGWDYSKLGEWCKSRKGHVMVCENTKANWLPFKAMKDQRGSIYTTTEAIWSNYHHDFEATQQSMFDSCPQFGI
jgi:site-specific DNA-adenine methylase